MAIAEIDLRRDLPKVRENWDDVVGGKGQCRYSAPCVVGAMMPSDQRRELSRRYDYRRIHHLLESGKVSAPTDQRKDISLLQDTFDDMDLSVFEAVLAELEAKYLTSGDK